MQRKQLFSDSKYQSNPFSKTADETKKDGGYRLMQNYADGDTTDNAASSSGCLSDTTDSTQFISRVSSPTATSANYLQTLLQAGKLGRSKLKHMGDGGAMARCGTSSAAKPASASKRCTSLTRNRQPQPTRMTARGTGGAGAVDEDAFLIAFDDVPKLNLFSARELLTHMQQIRDTLSDHSSDWEKRVDSLKKLRALLLADAVQYEEFYTELRTLEVPFQLAIKDLRSQVVREASITVAYVSQNLGMKFDHFAEAVLIPLINLIQNSAKVMATSGSVACSFIIKYTHSPKLISIITSSFNSKSREIRRACAEFVFQICDSWPTRALERHVTNLQEAIRQALSDADPDARVAARKAYWAFHNHFRDQADALFMSLDSAKQRHLQGHLSQSSSNNNIPAGVGLRSSQENLRGGLATPMFRTPGRSTSDIDTGAQRRARGGFMAAQAVRASRAARTAAVATHNMNSLPKPQSTGRPLFGASTVTPHTPATADRGRTPRTTRAGKSISQPGSRSGSPTSRYQSSSARKYRPPAVGYGSGLPIRSHGGSREHSPHRGERRYSTEENGGQSPPVMGRYLTHETDIGALLTHRPESMDLESEASSVCSERSFSTPSGRQLHVERWELSEALKRCQSTQWAERKEGLMCMQSLLKSRRPFTPVELKRICDTFNRLFADTHNKTFTLFMDTLVEFLVAYRQELRDWLYTLLIRLLTKQSSDLLSSVQTKLSRILGVVREAFPYQLQFNTLVRYIIDPANTPSLKMKVSVVNYLTSIASVMDSTDLKNSSDVRQAVQKIVSWAGEPKSAEVRRSSQTLLVTLFSTNAAEFTSILNTFSKSYQDSVYRLLQSQLVKPDTATATASGNMGTIGRSRSSTSPGPFGMSGNIDLDYVHDSLKRTSEEIQQYSFSGLQKVIGSQDSGIVDAVDSLQRAENDVSNGRLLMEQLCLNSDEERQQEIITDILTELSNHNTRTMERRKAMATLKYMTRDGTFTLWDEHFKAILLILLETLGDTDAEVRATALRVLGEICTSQAPRFRDYAELTILRVVDAHKDDDKDVVRAAEDCAALLANHLPPQVSLRILNPIIKNDESKASSMAAIKMVTKAVEKMTATDAEAVIPDVVPQVVKAFEHPTQSVIRKASVVCLVAFHQLVGMEKLQPFLTALNNSKLKLLNLYIMKRAEINSSSPTSQV